MSPNTRSSPGVYGQPSTGQSTFQTTPTAESPRSKHFKDENNVCKVLKVALTHGKCTVNGGFYLCLVPKISNKIFKDSDLKVNKVKL